MTLHLSRRQFLGASAAMAATLMTGKLTSAQSGGAYQSGAIGWPRQQFDNVYGTGRPNGDLVVYPNPYLANSDLSVMFQDGVAIFIDMLIPADAGVDPSQAPTLLQNLMPADATSLASWTIPNVDQDVPFWTFGEFNAQSMHMAGSGATRMQTCTAVDQINGGQRLVRATVSLAIPNGADQFAPAAGSLGVGGSGDEWVAKYGQGRNSEGAAGTYSADFVIAPWDDVVMMSQRTEGQDTRIITINAISYEGVSVADAMAFAESIIPQGAQRQAAYEAFAVPDRPQGWGTSTWAISENELMVLFILGAGNGSGDVLQVGSALYEAQ